MQKSEPRRSHLIPLLLTVLFAGSTVSTLPAQDSTLLRNIPDDTLAVFDVGNTPELIKHWEESPFAKLFEDEEIKRYLAPMQAEGKEAPWDKASKELSGHTLRQTLDIFKGEALIAIIGPSGEAPEKYFEERPGSLLVGRIGTDPAPFENFLAGQMTSAQEQSKEEYEEKTEDYLGVTLHLRKKTNKEGKTEEAEGWAVVGDTGIIAWPEALLRETVQSLKNSGDEAPLPADLTAHYQRAGGNPDLTLFVNLVKLVPAWRAALDKELRPKLENNPYGVTLDSILKALALENITSLTISSRLGAEQTEADLSLGYSSKEGILSLLTYTNGVLATPALVPGDTMHTATTRFSIPKFWDALLHIINEASPTFGGMINGQLGQLQTTMGVDIRKDILGALGDDFVFFEDLRKEGRGNSSTPPQPEYLYALSVTNQQGLETALTTLRNFLGQGMAAFEERDVLGTKIFSWSKSGGGADGAPVVEITHAVTDQWFLLGIGTSRPMERAIAGLKSPEASIWEKPLVKGALEQAGGSLSSFEYSNYSGAIPMLLNAVNAAQAKAPDEEKLVNPEASPDASVLAKYIGITTTTFRDDSGAFFSRALFHGSKSNE